MRYHIHVGVGIQEHITLWYLTDADSWLNHWPIQGRACHPLLFDRGGSPKPAFHAVIKTAKNQWGPITSSKQP